MLHRPNKASMSSCVCPTNMKLTYTSRNTPFATSNEKKQNVYLFLLSEHALSSWRCKIGGSALGTTDLLGGGGREDLHTFPPSKTAANSGEARMSGNISRDTTLGTSSRSRRTFAIEPTV